MLKVPGRVTSEAIRYYIEHKQAKHWRAVEKEEGQMRLDRYA